MKNKNNEVLKDFIKYCKTHPEERFWQALRNWSGYAFIWASNEKSIEPGVFDTFYFKGKDK
jgi:hypothetical protein